MLSLLREWWLFLRWDSETAVKMFNYVIWSCLFLCLLHFSLSFISASLSVCMWLNVYLSLSHTFYFSLRLLLYIQFHFSLAASYSKYFCLSLVLTPPLFVYACLFSFSVSVLLQLFLWLSVSICLSQVAFSEGCTLTWWNGVSLFLQRQRHFAVRITTPEIDGEEKEEIRVHHELSGTSDGTSKHCRN